MSPEDWGGRFHEAWAQLGALHEAQVASLTADVASLRAELGTDVVVQVAALKAEVEHLRAELGSARAPAEAPPKAQQAAAPKQAQQAAAPKLEPAPLRCSPGTPDGSWNHGCPSSFASAMAVELHARDLEQSGLILLDEGIRQRSKLSKGSQVALLRRSRGIPTREDFPLRRGWRGRCARVVQRPSFDVAMGLVIAMNAVCIGIESSIARAGRQRPAALDAMEYSFTAAYTVELAMRLIVDGLRGLTNYWIGFDLFFVISGLLHIVTKMVTTESIGFLETVSLVRMLRLARLARVFRLMTKFNSLWLLVHGLVNSLVTLISAGAIVFILLYVFSVIGLEVLQPDPQASDMYTQIIDTHFSSLFTTMLTLCQGLTNDSFSSIYRPLILEKPYLLLYFTPFVLTLPIALMNLVTAVMVNFSLDQATKDKEAQEQIHMEKREASAELLKKIFINMDTDASDRLDLMEMMNAPDEVQSLIFEIAEIKTRGSDRRQDLEDIFHILDFDASGFIEINEFCDGLVKLNNGNALDTMRFRKVFQNTMDRLMSMVYKNSVAVVSV